MLLRSCRNSNRIIPRLRSSARSYRAATFTSQWNSLLLGPPVRLHHVFAHDLLGRKTVVTAAQESQVRQLNGTVVCKWLDVVDLQPLPALASRSIRRDERALTLVAQP